VTPLRCEDGTVILVNRGWVPRDSTVPARDPVTGKPNGHAFGVPAAFSQPRGAQEVHGVLKKGEQKNKYAENKPEEQRYVWLDLATMASEGGSAPLLVVAAAQPGEQPDVKPEWPMTRPLESFLDFYVSPTTHLVYASTWGALSVAGAFMTFRRFR